MIRRLPIRIRIRIQRREKFWFLIKISTASLLLDPRGVVDSFLSDSVPLASSLHSSSVLDPVSGRLCLHRVSNAILSCILSLKDCKPELCDLKELSSFCCQVCSILRLQLSFEYCLRWLHSWA